MFFIKSKNNALQNNLFPAPTFLLNLSELASFRNVKNIPVGKEQLLISRETGGWCYLTEQEYFFYQLLNRVPIQNIIEKLGFARQDCLDLIHILCQRGLISFPGIESNGELIRPEVIERSFRLTFMFRSSCNLACRYCYLGGEKLARGHYLGDDQARAAIRLALSQDNRKIMVDFGEYNLAWESIKSLVNYVEYEAHQHRDKEIIFQVQTNGTGLTASKTQYLREHEFFVGISLDGPQEIHNRFRVDRQGRGSYQRVVAGLNRILNARIPYIVLTTITQGNWDKAQAVLAHFKSLGIQAYAFKPIIRRGLAIQEWDRIGMGSKEYQQFVRDEFNYAIDQKNADLLDETAVKFIFRALGDPRGWHNHCPTGYCTREKEVLFINPDGYVYPCPRFASNGDNPLSLFHILDGSDLVQLNGVSTAVYSAPPSCTDCLWKSYCMGGCVLSHFSGDDSCSGYQEIYQSIFGIFFPAIRAEKIGYSSKLGRLTVFEKNFFKPRNL